LGKALLIGGVVLLGMLVLGIAGTAYGVYWVKQKAMAKLSTYTGGMVGGSPVQVKVARGTACALLPREDLQRALGVAVEKSSEIMEGSNPGCAYYTNPAAFAQLRDMAAEQARRDSEAVQNKIPAKSDNPLELLKYTREMEGIVKALTLVGGDKEGQVFSFTIERGHGGSDWATLRATISVVPGFDEVPGVGDHAMLGSFGHAMYVLKGDAMIHLMLLYVPEARVHGAEIGRIIVARL
jgi:hypothetical protein